jgi:hypothetical protein
MLITFSERAGTFAVAVGTKVGHLFVLHRETGQPLSQ